MRSWFSGRTSPCQGGGAVSITAGRTKLENQVSFTKSFIYKFFIKNVDNYVGMCITDMNKRCL